MLAESLPSFRRRVLAFKQAAIVIAAGLGGAAYLPAAPPLWENNPEHAAFVVSDDSVLATSARGAGPSRLVARTPVQDFILEFEFRKDRGAPAATIELRSGPAPGRGSGYACSLSGSAISGPGALTEPAGRGWLYPLPGDPKNDSDWHRFRIEAIGSSLRTWVDGQPAAHIIDDSARTGRLALSLAAPGPSAPAGCLSQWRSFRLTTTNLPASPPDDLLIRNFGLNQLSAAEQAQGWRLLWDGVSSAGWRGAHRPAFPAGGWRIEAGELILSSTPPGVKRPGGDLVTEELYRAFEFQFDFLLTPGANSGVKYFVTEDFVPSSGITAIGLEYQLLDDERHPDARRGVNGDRKLASLYDIVPATPPPAETGLAPVIGQWQHGRIVVRPDQHAEHWLNGVCVVRYERGSPDYLAAVDRSAYGKFPRFGLAPAGRLLLQDHGDEVHFRNLKVRRLEP